MNYRALNFLFRHMKLAGLMIVVSAVPALAQFEVAPDHFDSTPTVEKKQAVKRSTVKTGTQNGESRLSTSGQTSPVAVPATVAVNHGQPASGNTPHRKLAQRRKTSTAQGSGNRKKQTSDDSIAMATRH